MEDVDVNLSVEQPEMEDVAVDLSVERQEVEDVAVDGETPSLDQVEMTALAAQLCSLMINPAATLDAQTIDRCAGAATPTNLQPAVNLAELVEHPMYQAQEVISLSKPLRGHPGLMTSIQPHTVASFTD